MSIPIYKPQGKNIYYYFFHLLCSYWLLNYYHYNQGAIICQYSLYSPYFLQYSLKIYQAFQTLYYTKQHLTLNINGPYVKLGITTYLRDCLGEITLLKSDYKIGDNIEEGEIIYNIESLKATNEILSPLNGELITINNQLIKNIKYIQHIEKEDDLWLLEFKWNEVDTEIFMDKDKYDWFTKPRI